MKPHNIKRVQRKSRTLTVEPLYRPQFMVHSGDHTYVVQVQFAYEIHAVCNCAWGQRGGMGCSHIMAVLEYLAQLKGRTLSFWDRPAQAWKQKRKTFILVKGDEKIWITSRKVKRRSQ